MDRHLADDHRFLRSVAFRILGVVAHGKREDAAGHIEPLRYLAEDREVAVEQWGLRERDVERAGGRVGLGSVAGADGADVVGFPAEFRLEPVAQASKGNIAQGTASFEDFDFSNRAVIRLGAHGAFEDQTVVVPGAGQGDEIAHVIGGEVGTEGNLNRAELGVDRGAVIDWLAGLGGKANAVPEADDFRIELPD